MRRKAVTAMAPNQAIAVQSLRPTGVPMSSARIVSIIGVTGCCPRTVQDRWHGVGRDEGAAHVGQEEWILQIPITGPPLTPGQMRWIEQTCGSCRPRG